MIICFKLIVDKSVQIDTSVEIDCSDVCTNWMFVFLFKLFVHKSFQIEIPVQHDWSCFCSNWSFFCSKRIVHMSVQIDCWFQCSNSMIIYPLKLIVDTFVQIDCWHFSSKWYFCSNWLCIICSNWSFIFLIKLINQFSVQNACPCFFFNLRFLFKLIVLIFVHNWLLIFLIKIDC